MGYQLRGRCPFMRFVGLGLGDAVPDAKTLWLYREALTQAGAVEGLFNQFDGYLKAKGYLAMGGQIIDATIVPTPRQRNSREDNAAVKAGKTPLQWKKKQIGRASCRGKSVLVRVDLGGRRIIEKKKKK